MITIDDLETIRVRSIIQAKAMGYKTNPSLPILDVPRDKRSLDDVVDRILGMYCLGACAYGFPPDKAYVWLEN